MTELGRPIAAGRAADIFDLGDGKVLRRYRTDIDVGPEHRLMTELFEAGFPVPKVHDGGGRDLVMDLVPGPTMADDFSRRPWKLESHVRELATLQIRLGELPAPDSVRTAPGVPEGSSILHLDLHPMNVIVSPDGPVVIDWTNARRGHADFDAGMTYVLAAAFEPSSVVERIGVGLMLRRFRRHRGVSAIGRWWDEAIHYRRADPNLTPGEVSNLEQLRRSGPPQR
jgi:tRNA A-37 threonylcarbamoyl transferase component Bud32